MSLTSRTSAVLLASAVAGLTTIGHASNDDWETPITSAAVEDDVDCDAPPSDEPRDELMILDELVTELQCTVITGICGVRPRCCFSDPD